MGTHLPHPHQYYSLAARDVSLGGSSGKIQGRKLRGRGRGGGGHSLVSGRQLGTLGTVTARGTPT